MSVKIHGVPASSNVMGPVLLAKTLGVGDMEFCDVMSGAHKSEVMLKVNPFGHIPSMEDGAIHLGESTPILRYIAMKYGKTYYPSEDADQCARIDWAMEAFNNEVYPHHLKVACVVMGFASKPEDQVAANKKYRDSIDLWIETFLKNGKFVCGDKLTIADFKVVPNLFCAIQPGLSTIDFAASERTVQYCNDFCDAVASSGMLKEAGGFSIAEWIKSKTS